MILDIAGDGQAMATIRQVATRTPGGGAIRLRGWIDRQRLVELYTSAHVYVSMPRAESWDHAAADALDADSSWRDLPTSALFRWPT